MKSGRAPWQEEEETRNDFSIVLILQEKFYLRALQGHSGRNPSLQDNVLIPDGFFKFNYHVGCAINLHPIINSGLISRGQNLSNIQTVFFLPVDPMDKEHKDPETIDLVAARLTRTCIEHGRNIKTRCIGSTSTLLWRKDWRSIRHDRTPSFFMKHSQYIVSQKLLGWKLEMSYTKKFTCHLDWWKLFGWKWFGMKVYLGCKWFWRNFWDEKWQL